jgi:streptogrisin C
MRFKKTVIGAVVVAAMACVVTPAAAGERPDGSADIYKALERDMGWSREQADANGELQLAATQLDVTVQKHLGDAYAGSFFDIASGKLIVNVTTEASVATANMLGASGRLVKHSLSELDSIKAKLDDAAGGTGTAADRKEPGRSNDLGVSAWSVDPITNSVLVSVTEQQVEAARRLVAEFGDAVTLEEIKAAPEPAANWMDGGDAVNGGSCSAGFNLRNTSTGAKYLLTAGHCVNAGSSLSGQGGVNFGAVLESWFPSYDDAIIRNDNTGYWIQGPWVDTNPSNGGIVTSSGFTDGLVGTVICKSGITTKWTCGTITAKNQTVTYTGGNTIYGLTRHNACVEPGDSGGANISVSGATRRAEGVTSGASLIEWGGVKRCVGAIFGWLGFQSTSWYFPIADSLAYYGPKYGVSTW